MENVKRMVTNQITVLEATLKSSSKKGDNCSIITVHSGDRRLPQTCVQRNNNNNNIHICIAPYGRNFRGAGPGSVLVGVRRGKRVSLGEEKCL